MMLHRYMKTPAGLQVNHLNFVKMNTRCYRSIVNVNTSEALRNCSLTGSQLVSLQKENDMSKVNVTYID
jgi:hypothetical protein